MPLDGTTDPTDGVTTISRSLFLPTTAITLHHVEQVFGAATITMSEEEKEGLVSFAKKAKREATRYGDHNVKAMIVDHMKAFGYELASWSELLDEFRKNDTEEFAADLWSACFGMFDKMPGWERKMEMEYMQLRKFEYHCGVAYEDGKVPKGCFARLFSNVKNDKVKNLNRFGKSGHGGFIKLHRDKSEITEETRGKKRKKGTTLGSFAVVRGKNHFNPENTIQKRIKVEKENPPICSQHCQTTI